MAEQNPLKPLFKDIANAIREKDGTTALIEDASNFPARIRAIPSGGLPEGVHTITVEADPPEGGSVSGGGYASDGMTVTVSAKNLGGYDFVGWKENGETVSTNTSYTLSANGDRILKAAFAVHTISLTLGKIWTQVTGLPVPSNANSYNNLAFGNGVYLAAVQPSASSAYILKSTNGKTWSTLSIGSAASQTGYIWFANGMFFYTRTKTAGMRISTDGTTWTAVNMPTAPTTYEWQISGGDGQLLAIDAGGSGKCYRSTNGTSWTAGTTAPATLLHIGYGGGMFLGVSSTGAAYITKDHGLSWASAGTGPKYPNSIVYANGKFYVASSSKSYGVKEYTPGTNTWRDLAATAMGDDASVICGFAGDDNIILLLTNNRAHTSRDGGITWEHVDLPANKAKTNPVLGEDIFVAVNKTASEKISIWSA